MDCLKIPSSLALLGLSFTGCGKADDKADEDSIVGTWDATMVGDTEYPYTGVNEEGGTSTTKVALVIGEDLTGTYRRDVTYAYPDGGSPHHYFFEFELAVDDAGPGHVLTIPELDEALMCTISGALMACDSLAGGQSFKFERR